MLARRDQPWPVRVFHWLNVVALVVLAGSGLQILMAFPSFGPQGKPFGVYPFNGVPPPDWLRLGGWLAGARHLHFAFAWLLVGNALFYLAWILATHEWRRRWFLPGRDVPGAVRTARAYLRFNFHDEGPGLYNGLQRIAYTSTIFIGLLVVLSGLAIYKPTQLRFLEMLFGGYDNARFIHFLSLLAFAFFTLGHLFMVALHPRAFLSIFTGGKVRPVPPEDAP